MLTNLVETPLYNCKNANITVFTDCFGRILCGFYKGLSCTTVSLYLLYGIYLCTMNIRARLLLCKKCKHVNPRSALTPFSSRESPYFLICTCVTCDEAWFICPLHNRRWTARNQYAAAQHFQDITMNHRDDDYNHDDTNDFNHTSDNDDTETTAVDSNVNCGDVDDNNLQMASPHNDKFSFMSSNSQKYFNLYLTKANELPAQYIVHAAFAQNSAPSSRYCNMFETEFHLQATKLCLSTTNLQHTNIVTLFHMLESCINLSVNEQKFANTRLPLTMAEINKFYISKSTSIRKSLPYPKPKEIHNHVFVSLKDVMSHMFAYGTTMNGICPYENHEYMGTYVNTVQHDIAQTPFVTNIINQTLQKFPPTEDLKPLILLGTVWSDGFDANNVVHTAPSIWMRTITIAPPQDMSTSTRHTFVLHMSREGICHEQIDILFCNELYELENGMWFYSTLLKKSIFVILKIYVYAADRPERGKLTHILGHTGISTKRWMYSAYLPPANMQSCNLCFKWRSQMAKDNPTFFNVSNRRCGRCADWNFDHPQMRVDLPDGYPETCHSESPSPQNQRQIERVRHLYPMVLTFNNLKASANFIFFNVYKKTFTQKIAKVYGKSVGLAIDYTQNAVIAKAQKLREENPNMTCDDVLNKITYPTLWNCSIQLNQYIDAPMHLIFQGIIKSLIEMISEWLIALSTKNVSYHKNFCTIVHPLMVSISNMNITWCSLNTFNTTKKYKPTGWIANNYLAFARIMLVVYRYIRSVVKKSEAGLLECEGMIQSGLCLVSYIMSKHNNDPKPIMEYTKLFLSCVDKFEAKVYVVTSIKPIWKTRGNFLSLLNLPLQQEYFGTVRNFWEGERERYIQHIKPLLSQLRHSTSFLVTKLERLYQHIALDYILETIPNSVMAKLKGPTYERNCDFLVYKDVEAVNALISKNQPLSGIEIRIVTNAGERNKFCIVVKHMEDSYNCYEIIFDSDNGFKRCAHFYSEVQFLIENTNCIHTYNTRRQLLDDICHHILLLPNLQQNNKQDYTIISNEWTYLQEDLSLSFCCIQNNLFTQL